jgi:hypothetical protein
MYAEYKTTIPPSTIRLAVTFRYLVSGDSISGLMNAFKSLKHSVSVTIPEVCEILLDALSEFV